MQMLSAVNKYIRHFVASIRVQMALLSPSPALADGFQRANTVMEKVSTGLHGLAAITITVAVIWIGYKTLWKGENLAQCGYIIIGGILIGGGSEIGALLMS